ncbi:hypothetical protein JW960_19215 [candidate division KSB1 bacterium]|nr:hypothetical protein [candidate division KSB1 bacterium]
MKADKNIVVFITLVSLFNARTVLNAQVKNSVYSMFGVGQIADNSFGINKSMGGTGIAFQSGSSLNYSNPASYLGIPPNSFNMELGAIGILSRAESKSIVQTTGDLNFGYCALSLYVSKWWAAMLGVAPFSSVDYEIHTTDNVEGELIPFEKEFTGTGGLSKVFVGNSFHIFKGLAGGVNVSLIFGPITQTEIAISSGSFSGYELTNHQTAYSFYMDYGLQYSIRKNDWQYTVGLIYGASKRLTVTSELDFTYDDVTTTLEQKEQVGIKIPEKRGIGFAIKKGNQFRAGIDYEWRKWATINFSNPNLDTRNSNRFSAGLEFTPMKRDSWLKRLSYRMGAHYSNSYLEIKNTQINSIGVVAGVGIPNKLISLFNIAFEYGSEGTLDKGLIRNDYWMMDFSFSVHEFWGR